MALQGPIKQVICRGATKAGCPLEEGRLRGCFFVMAAARDAL